MTYATLEQAAEYHYARLSKGAWTALSDADRKAALQEASDNLDAYAALHGGWREAYTAETVPDALMKACCIEALMLTDAGIMTRRNLQQQGVKSSSIGGASESYGEGAAFAHSALLSPQAERLLKPYLKRTGMGVPIL